MATIRLALIMFIPPHGQAQAPNNLKESRQYCIAVSVLPTGPHVDSGSPASTKEQVPSCSQSRGDSQ